jgi:nucleotide-binding universal stress UspA family protein
MKTLLVLTDFSPAAQNAAEAAIAIGGAINANVLLLNAFMVATVGITTEPMPWPLEYYHVLEQDSIDRMKLEKERLSLLSSDFSTICRGGNLAGIVQEIVEERDVDLIFMGARHTKGIELLFGSDIHQVIGKSKKPVFIIPRTKLKMPLNNVIFASDLSQADLRSLNFLLELAASLNFHIDICHVSDRETEVPAFIAYSKLPQVTFNTLKGTNIREELVKFVHQKAGNLLVLTYKKHSFFWSIFHETPAKDLIRTDEHPLLILPCQD